MSGLFISFEGIDGAGKSTHIDALAQAFRTQGRVVTQTREPGGTPLAEELRRLILNSPMGAMTEALLAFAARRDHLEQVIVPALARGEVVLCDRFSDATFAYQGAGRGFDWSVLTQLEQWVQHLPVDPGGEEPSPMVEPAFTVWFDVPVEVAAQRLISARTPDKFEAQPHLFFEKVAGGYAKRMAENPLRFIRVNANQTPTEVWAEVQNGLRERAVLL